MGHALGLRLDPVSDEPLYRQIFDQVVERIRSGALPAGFRLPPSRALAEELGAHRNTVVRAYDDLEAAGFVASTVGRGTFVAAHVPRAAPQREARAGAIPWGSLLSRASTAEPLGRFEQLQRGVMPIDTINLTRMQPSPDLVPDELLRRCASHVMKTHGGRAFGYGARDGLPRLRAAIADDLRRQGVPASADDVVVTSGSQQALDLVVRALVNPGEAFLVEELTYSGALNVLHAHGARVVGVAADDEGPSLPALERLALAGAKGLYVMPNANNPTGAQISLARREALVAWSRRTATPLIEDDYVGDLNLDRSPLPPPLRALDGDVVHLGTYSKRLAPALRVGYVVCPPALRPRLATLKHALDLGNSDLLQHTLAEFLERGYLPAHLARTLPEYRRRRDGLEEALARHLPKGLGPRRAPLGVTLWLPLPSPLSPQQAFEQARREGVLVHPSMLNAAQGRDEGGVRLSFCAEPLPRLVEGAKRLGRALSALLAEANRAPSRRARGSSDNAVGGV